MTGHSSVEKTPAFAGMTSKGNGNSRAEQQYKHSNKSSPQR